MAALVICLSVRMVVTFLLMAGNKLTKKEKIFVAIAWLPKATVQVCNERTLILLKRKLNYGCSQT